MLKIKRAVKKIIYACFLTHTLQIQVKFSLNNKMHRKNELKKHLCTCN